MTNRITQVPRANVASSNGRPPIVVGVDTGNSQSTLAVARTDGIQHITIPSFIGTGTLADLQRMRGGASGQSASRMPAGEYALEDQSGSFFVGNLALTQTLDATAQRGDISRYWNGHTRRLLLTLAGSMFKLKQGDELTMRVVTSLPVSVWNRDTTVKQVTRALVGDHEFVLNGKLMTIHIEAVAVLMESAGALALHGGATEGVPQAVIDIGGRTTDRFWTLGQKPVLPRCGGTPHGVDSAADMVAHLTQQMHGRELSPLEVRSIMRAYAHGKTQPAVMHKGQSLNVFPLVSRAVSVVADQIVSDVSREWRSGESGDVAAEASPVLIIGGGPYYFADRIKRVIPHAVVPNEPEVANALGNLAIGQKFPEAIWNRLRG